MIRQRLEHLNIQRTAHTHTQLPHQPLFQRAGSILSIHFRVERIYERLCDRICDTFYIAKRKIGKVFARARATHCRW